MIYSLRGVALLMLVAGISLGVFAGTLIAIKRTPTPLSLEQTVEERVKLYREFYDLDVGSTDAIRRELQRHRRELRDKLVDLRRRHADEFNDLVTETETRIEKILKSARVKDDAPDEDGERGR
jgi:hypothetical protein